MIALKQILVATDFSTPSESALRYGRALAEAFGATLHVLHVLEDIVAHAWMPEVYVASLPDVHAEMERAARERLSHLFSPGEQETLRPVLALRRGSAYPEIVNYAEAQRVDLIVVGTHGRGAIAHMMIGSVAEKVVRKAPCPVLTVRHPEQEFVQP